MRDEKVLQRELNFLNGNDVIKSFVEAALNIVPEQFYTMPASRRGKYHSQVELGSKGLLTHTMNAVYCGRRMCRAYGANLDVYDIVTAALILHDIAKSWVAVGAEPHELAAEAFLETISVTDERWRGNPLILRVIGCVRWHSGVWSPGAVAGRSGRPIEGPLRNFPEDFTFEQQLTHLGDYAAAGKAATFDLEYGYEGARNGVF